MKSLMKIVFVHRRHSMMPIVKELLYKLSEIMTLKELHMASTQHRNATIFSRHPLLLDLIFLTIGSCS